MIRAQNRKNMYILIIIVTLVLIGIGYALLTDNLNILGNARVNSNNWDVRFENLQVTPGSVEADTPVITNNTTITYTVNLNTTGDYYEFYVDVANRGTIDAMIDSINIDNLTAEQKKYLDYSVTYNSGLELAEKQELKAGNKEKLKVRIYYKEDILSSDLPTENDSLTLSVSIDYVQADDTATTLTHPVCTRATTLHKETCNPASYNNNCIAAGYNSGDTITYGSLGTTGTLSSGDAFDCDVNKDGEYNTETERFYYVSSLDTSSNYGVLIYYNNVSVGEPNNTTTYAYDSANIPRENGPITAVQQLPTTSQWSNVSLSNTTRKIKDEQGNEYIDFSYEGYAARLLTYQEVRSACGNNVDTFDGYDGGDLDSCKYLLENTIYSNSTLKSEWWLENPFSFDLNEVWVVVGFYRSMLFSSALNSETIGVRPTIEVPKSKMNY